MIEKDVKGYKTPLVATHANLEKMLTIDGFDYSYVVTLPDLDFSTGLLADQNRYYSYCIVNQSLTASLIHARTHYNKSRYESVEEKLLGMKTEDLPCPKGKTFVYIPLRFTMIPDFKNGNKIPKNEMDLVCGENELKDLVNRHIITKKRKDCVIRDFTRFKNWLKQKTKHEWFRTKWLDREWSIEVQSKKDHDYNASLRINILVGASGIDTGTGTKTFMANLRLNPTSKCLYNLNLMLGSLSEIDKHWKIGKEILNKLFEENTHRFFSRQASTHQEDLIIRENKGYALKQTYLTLAYATMRERMKGIRGKIGNLAYSKNIKVKTDTNILLAKLRDLTFDTVKDTFWNGENLKEQLDQMNNVSVRTHLGNGFTVSQKKKNRLVFVAYTKNKFQDHQKASRLMRDRFKAPRKYLEVLETRKYESNIIRLEITVWGHSQIHLPHPYDFLDKMETILRQLDAEMSPIITDNLEYPSLREDITSAFKLLVEMDKILQNYTGLSPPLTNNA